VEAQLADAGSSLNLYRRLIELRAASPALRAGHYARPPAAADGYVTYIREAAADRRLVALNLTSEERVLALDRGGRIAISSALDRDLEAVHDALRLRPDEGVVVDLA